MKLEWVMVREKSLKSVMKLASAMKLEKALEWASVTV
jgi:hypothetical protein